MSYVLTNKDIQVLIRIENLIGRNEKTLFDKKGEFPYIETYYNDGEKSLEFEKVTKNDFLDYINIVEKLLQQRMQAREKSRKWVKDNADKHREYNRKAYYTKNLKAAEYYEKVTKAKLKSHV